MSIGTVEPSPEEVADARLVFGTDPHAFRCISELLDAEELGDLFRTVRSKPIPEDMERAIDEHPFASDSRKAKFRIGMFLWNGRVPFRHTDPFVFDAANREKFIRAMRVFVGLPPEP